MAAVWGSYAELAEHLGISPEAARQKSIRARWERKLGDDGKARVLVDLEEAAAAMDDQYFMAVVGEGGDVLGEQTDRLNVLE